MGKEDGRVVSSWGVGMRLEEMSRWVRDRKG